MERNFVIINQDNEIWVEYSHYVTTPSEVKLVYRIFDEISLYFQRLDCYEHENVYVLVLTESGYNTVARIKNIIHSELQHPTTHYIHEFVHKIMSYSTNVDNENQVILNSKFWTVELVFDNEHNEYTLVVRFVFPVFDVQSPNGNVIIRAAEFVFDGIQDYFKDSVKYSKVELFDLITNQQEISLKLEFTSNQSKIDILESVISIIDERY